VVSELAVSVMASPPLGCGYIVCRAGVPEAGMGVSSREKAC
jgi:hypothetical protein